MRKMSTTPPPPKSAITSSVSWTAEDIEFLQAPPGYTCERNRKTGEVLYFKKVPPGCFCGGPEVPFNLDLNQFLPPGVQAGE